MPDALDRLAVRLYRHSPDISENVPVEDLRAALELIADRSYLGPWTLEGIIDLDRGDWLRPTWRLELRPNRPVVAPGPPDAEEPDQEQSVCRISRATGLMLRTVGKVEAFVAVLEHRGRSTGELRSAADLDILCRGLEADWMVGQPRGFLRLVGIYLMRASGAAEWIRTDLALGMTIDGRMLRAERALKVIHIAPGMHAAHA